MLRWLILALITCCTMWFAPGCVSTGSDDSDGDTIMVILSSVGKTACVAIVQAYDNGGKEKAEELVDKYVEDPMYAAVIKKSLPLFIELMRKYAGDEASQKELKMLISKMPANRKQLIIQRE